MAYLADFIIRHCLFAPFINQELFLAYFTYPILKLGFTCLVHLEIRICQCDLF